MRVLAALALAAALPLQAAERPEAFGYGASIRVAGNAAIYGVALPEAVYRDTARADLGDIRVFNAAGEAVPFAFVPRPADAVAPPAGVTLPLFPLRAPAGAEAEGLDVRVHRAADGTIVNIAARDASPGDRDRLAGYLIDASAFKGPLQALELALAGTGDLVARVRVEASDDLATWRNLAADAPVVRLTAEDQRLSATRVLLPAQQSKYLRLSWPAKGPMVELTGVQAQPPATVVEPTRLWVSARGIALKERPGVYDFDAGGRFPADRIRVVLPEPNTVAYVTLLSRAAPDAGWLPVRVAAVYRLQSGLQSGLQSARGELVNPDLVVGASGARYWQLRVDPRSGALGGGEPRLEFGWVPQQIAFAARGSAPFLLAWGNAAAQPASLPIETLVPGYRRDAAGRQGGADALVAIAPAALGEPRPIAGASALEPRTDWKRVVLWGSLVAAVMLLGWMAWRLARRIAPSAGGKGSAR